MSIVIQPLKYHYLKEVSEEKIDYAIMMDSLEYMEKDIRKLLHLPIDPEHKVTTGWNYAENSFITRLLTWCLNLDFLADRLLSKIGIKMPGLSLLVVCRRTNV